MLSRSHLLIQRELDQVGKIKLWGIEVSLINDNMYEWSVRINGPISTPWEGGIFRVYLKFDEHYSTRPPKVCFHTIPYHPNIDMITGRPCIDYLDDIIGWRGEIKISSLLLQIQNMLGCPVLENPVNPEAASMLIASPATYKNIARECVEYSRKIDGGHANILDGRQYSLQNILETYRGQHTPENQNSPKAKRTTKLSFDDYLSQWNGLATTKPSENSVNTYLETIKNEDWLRRIHFGMTEEELLEEDFEKQVEYDNVYYGAIHERKPTVRERGGRDSKLARINNMRKIYLPKKPLPTPRSPTARLSDSEGEVDNLVAWTQNLNADDL